MKKLVIFAISIILIFLLSFYIGMKFDTQNKKETMQEAKIQQEEKPNEIEQAVSEDETNKEHYVLRNVKGYIKVYSIDDNDEEELYLSTDIATEYLPETDKISLREGIHVYSKKELHEMLQDFE